MDLLERVLILKTYINQPNILLREDQIILKYGSYDTLYKQLVESLVYLTIIHPNISYVFTR